jgi:hypothetical protein
MTKQLDLGAFLSEQMSEGTVEGQGQFTVSHTQAARKLAKFALPRPSAWVTKLVQAANRWNCSAVQMRQTSTETLFHFTLPRLREIPTEDAIVASLLSGKVGGQSALDAFCLALRALVEQANLSFILVADDGFVQPRPVYSGHHYGALSERERMDKRFRPQPGLSLTVYHRPPTTRDDDLFDVLARLRSYIPVIEELDRYCHVSSVPLLLDGRRVDSLIESPGLGFSRSVRPLFFLGLNALSHSPESMPLPQDFEEKLVSLLSHSRRITRSYGGEGRFQAALVGQVQAFPPLLELSRLKRRSRLLWVTDGVIVEEEQLDVRTTAVGLNIFINGAGLPTDLTAVIARRREVLQAVGELLRSKRVRSQDYFRVDRDPESSSDEEHDQQEAVRRRIKILLRGSGTGLALTMVNPAVGVPTTLGSIAAAYARKPKDPHAEMLTRKQVLEKTIPDDLTLLRDYLAEPGGV